MVIYDQITRKARDIAEETTTFREGGRSTKKKILKNVLYVHLFVRYEQHRGEDVLEVQIFAYG